MNKIIGTINKHGQVKIPAMVRRVLGIQPGDKVTFTIESGEVCLSRVTFTLESAYGSVKPSRKPEDFEDISRAAKEAKAEKTLRKLRKHELKPPSPPLRKGGAPIESERGISPYGEVSL